MRTKGELRSVSTFDKMYLHIQAIRIADIPRTGAIDDVERALNLEHLRACWNAFEKDGLVSALVEALSVYHKIEKNRFPSAIPLPDSPMAKAEAVLEKADKL